MRAMRHKTYLAAIDVVTLQVFIFKKIFVMMDIDFDEETFVDKENL
jgi:hypothetical protein